MAALLTEHQLTALTDTIRERDHEQHKSLYDIAFVNSLRSGSVGLL